MQNTQPVVSSDLVTYACRQGDQILSVGGRLGGRRHVHRLAGFLVDQVLQFLARLEVRHSLRWHVHLVAGLRVAPLPGLALTEAEAAESAEFDLLATLQ